MRTLVTLISDSRRGQSTQEERCIESPEFTIGRSSKCELRLPDARVALEHLRVIVEADGATVERLGGELRLNGRSVERARLSSDDVLEIGPFRATVAPPSELYRLSLVIQAPKARRALNTVRAAIHRSPRLSKRRLSYLAFFGVLLLTLMIPLTSEWLSDQPELVEDWPAMAAVIPAVAQRVVQTWNPGPLSRSHQVFAEDCTACHRYAFLQVRDSACISCHVTIREHVPRESLSGSLGAAFSETRCAECHRDHKGINMAPRAQEECALCHRDIKAVAPNAASENVTDFARGHPEFRVSIKDASTSGATSHRIRLSAPPSAGLVERSNLKFDHAVHMDPAGVRHPRKGQERLQCSSCHTPDEGGRIMQPVSMEKHCQECHLLEFEPKMTRRQVPHGSAEGAATMLREFYARLVLGDVPPDMQPPPDLPRVRPGAELSYAERQEALRIADERAQAALRELFETRDVCSTCHFVQRDPIAGWKVAPVRITRTWMPHAQFSHAKHATEACTVCHKSESSTKAADVAMPSVEVCQSCHAGAKPVLGKVTSDCATCHRFHAGDKFWHHQLQTELQSKQRK